MKIEYCVLEQEYDETMRNISIFFNLKDIVFIELKTMRGER